MRLSLLLLVLASAYASAQPTGPPLLNRVDQIRLSEDQQALVQRDAGLRAMVEVEEGTARARRGYALYATGEDCSLPRAFCAVVAGRDPVITITIPFASDGGLGTTRVETLHRVDGVRLSDRQVRLLAADPNDKDALRLDEEGRLWAGEGVSLVATDPSADDCGHPRVQCGVVFEVETTLRIIMIGE